VHDMPVSKYHARGLNFLEHKKRIRSRNRNDSAMQNHPRKRSHQSTVIAQTDSLLQQEVPAAVSAHETRNGNPQVAPVDVSPNCEVCSTNSENESNIDQKYRRMLRMMLPQSAKNYAENNCA